MKRDMDLVREMLLAIEREPAGSVNIRVEIPGRDVLEIEEHLFLLRDGRLIRCGEGKHLPRVDGLSWAGHEFLDGIRDPIRWKRAKEIAVEKTGALSFEALKEIAKALVAFAIRGGMS